MTEPPTARGASRQGASRSAISPASLRTLAQRPSRTKEVYEALRLAIASRELEPGSLHSVAELAETFGVSRTPVREALIDLSSRNVIRFERNRGVRILESTTEDLLEIFELRLLLEVKATGLATAAMGPAQHKLLRAAFDDLQQATTNGDDLTYWASDRAFHEVLLQASGNERLCTILDNLRDSILVRGATSAGRTRTLEDITADHEQILDAVLSGDPKQAGAAMYDHLRRTIVALLERELNGDAEAEVVRLLERLGDPPW